jgi:hypothetical protein
VWRNGNGRLIALDFATGTPLVAEGGLSDGAILWLSDGYVYDYAGARCSGFRVCEDGGFCTGGGAKQVGVQGDIFAGYEPYTAPAWSPVTREVVARAGNDLLYAGCTDGQAHWMLQLPPVRAVNAGLYVRESGEIVFVADTSYVFSPDGEVLRQNTIDALSLGLAATSAATFVEGCGALLVGHDRWAWLDAETLTLGPPIVIPGGYPAFSSFTATEDCGVAAVVNPVVPTLMRFSRDGDVLWGVPTGTARAPVALDDGGFLVIAVDGYQIVDADGNVRETVFHQAPIASCSFEATLAPDGNALPRLRGRLTRQPLRRRHPHRREALGPLRPRRRHRLRPHQRTTRALTRGCPIAGAGRARHRSRMGTSLIDRRFVRPRRPTQGLRCAPGLALLAAFGSIGCQPSDAPPDGPTVSPLVVYRHERPTCPSLERPVFRARPVAGDVPGQPRWVVGSAISRSIIRSTSSTGRVLSEASLASRRLGRPSGATSTQGAGLGALSRALGRVLYTGAGSGSDSVAHRRSRVLVRQARWWAAERICEDGDCLHRGQAVVGVEDGRQLRTITRARTTLTYPAWSPLTRGGGGAGGE